MKIIFIIIDGLGDKPISRLKNKTPLEAAKTPNLDWLAEKGICGLIKPFYFPWQGYPNSDTAHLALFGYSPKKYYLGRGPYEAVGIGFDVKEGDLALRANFGTIDDKLKVIDRRAGRIRETQSLVKAINGIKIDGVKFFVKKSYGHRAILVLRGKSLSEKITDSDPHRAGDRIKKALPKDKSKEAKFTAQILNKFLEKVYLILKSHSLNRKRERAGKLPANYLLVRGAGKLRKTPSFYQKYKLKACCIAGGALYKGIAKILGMEIINIKGANGFSTTNLRGKFAGIKKALKKYDFIFCHIKATDSLAEDGNFQGKKIFIEKIDKNINPLVSLKNTLIIITADHSTCSSLKRHCVDPVPLLIYREGIKQDKVSKFSEKNCEKGQLGKIKQLTLLSKVMNIYKK